VCVCGGGEECFIRVLLSYAVQKKNATTYHLITDIEFYLKFFTDA